MARTTAQTSTTCVLIVSMRTRLQTSGTLSRDDTLVCRTSCSTLTLACVPELRADVAVIRCEIKSAQELLQASRSRSRGLLPRLYGGFRCRCGVRCQKVRVPIAQSGRGQQ
eukprot:8273923-Pyramimonas_sp.AAC.1